MSNVLSAAAGALKVRQGFGHFKSWVPGRRIFGRGKKLFSAISWGCENILRAILMGYKTILVEKILEENIDQRLKEKITD